MVRRMRMNSASSNTVRCGECSLVEGDSRFDIARDVQKTGLQEQAVRGFLVVHGGLDGRQRGIAIAVTPMDVRDYQVDVGPLVRGSIRAGREHGEPFDSPFDPAAAPTMASS